MADDLKSKYYYVWHHNEYDERDVYERSLSSNQNMSYTSWQQIIVQ